MIRAFGRGFVISAAVITGLCWVSCVPGSIPGNGSDIGNNSPPDGSTGTGGTQGGSVDQGGTGGAGSGGTGSGTGGDTTGGDTGAGTGTGSGTGGGSTGTPTELSTLQVFPADNPWNQDISSLPVHPNSRAFLESMGLDTGLHPDFGTVWDGAPIGIPFVTVRGDQPRVPVSFYYGDESDPGPYPIPPDAPIEGGANSDGDRHVLVVDLDNKMLYEMFDAHPQSDGSWDGGSGAVFDLTSNSLRPAGWTSADAAGLPIFPGLVRYDEVVEKGEITHAIRFTVQHTREAYISPARHYASSNTDLNVPPMGLRVRLRANFDISSFSPHLQVILRAMQKYGMFVADNGSNWYISGAHDPRWDDEELHDINRVHGSDFEVVYTGDPEN
ncbi:MAG: hypothetical protein HYR83_12175 [Planctomycetes bacterium]|nr:hypothetical protein [Planctomycetota bacterium]